MIAALMESSMRDTRLWTGPVGAVLGTCLYVDLSSDRSSEFKEGIALLEREIRVRRGALTWDSFDLIFPSTFREV